MADNVKIQLIGPIEEQVGVSEVYYNGETVRSVLEQFINDYRDKLEKFVDPKTGFFHKFLMILLNTELVILKSEKFDTKLNSDDHIIIALPIGGG